MEKRPFGRNGTPVTVLGQGTWQIGDKKSAVAALRRGIDLGMTHIDTAELYGDAELVIAEAIAGRRDELYIVDKVLPSNASRKGTLAACERSLKRLKTDRIDCYLLHWRGSYPLSDTVAALEQLAGEGKILSWGVSNFDVSDMEELFSISEKAVCNQVLYHLEERAIEHAVMPWCEKHGVAVVAYSPFGSGRFPKHRVLDEVAKAHGATARQVALAFLTLKHFLFAIPKSENPTHTAENAGAAKVKLTAQDIDKLDKAFPRGRPRALPMI